MFEFGLKDLWLLALRHFYASREFLYIREHCKYIYPSNFTKLQIYPFSSKLFSISMKNAPNLVLTPSLKSIMLKIVQTIMLLLHRCLYGRFCVSARDHYTLN